MVVRRDISLQSSAAFHTVFPLDYSTPPGTSAGICGACKTWQDAQFKWTGGSSAVSVAPGWSRGLAHYEGLLEVHALEKSKFFSEKENVSEMLRLPSTNPTHKHSLINALQCRRGKITQTYYSRWRRVSVSEAESFSEEIRNTGSDCKCSF